METDLKTVQIKTKGNKRERTDHRGDERPACAPRRRSGRRDDAAFRGPRDGERPRVEDAVAEHFFGREPVGLSVAQIRVELRRHLVRDGIGHTQPPPLAAALLDERVHAATSVAVSPSTASTASRAVCHSAIPAASAMRPASDAR